MPVDNLIESSINQDTVSKNSVNKNTANKDSLAVESSSNMALALVNVCTDKDQDDGTTMAYRHQLQQCQLDYSINSLKRIDLLLSKIRHELIANSLTEAAFLAQPSCQRFLRFVGRYSGQVLAKQWHNQAYWLSEEEIDQWNKKIGVTPDPNNFYQQLACRYQSLDDNPVTAPISSKTVYSTFDAIYFALEPIGAIPLESCLAFVGVGLPQRVRRPQCATAPPRSRPRTEPRGPRPGRRPHPARTSGTKHAGPI